MKDGRKTLPLLLLACALLLTACSAGGEQPSPDGGAVLIYATLNPERVDRGAVEDFNQRHEHVKVEVRDYSQEDGRGRDRLMAEIAAGHAPDIIDLGWEAASPTLLPYRQLAEKGYLEDLWPYIEDDPSLGRERVVEAPLKAAEVNGGLYTVFESFMVYTASGAAGVVGDRTSWSLAELLEAFADMPEGSTVEAYWMPKRGMLEILGYMLLEEFVDWETGVCSFDSDEFRSFLTFVNSFPMEADMSENVGERRLEGRQLIMSEIIGILGDLAHQALWYGGEISYIGYPVEDGSVGSCFVPSRVKLSIASTCPDKEAAWDFVRKILLPKAPPARGSSEPLYEGIPVNRAAYEEAKRSAMTAKRREEPLYEGGPVVEIPPLSEVELRRFEELVDSIDRIELGTNAIFHIVEDACGPYFAGDRTLDETVELIQNRVQLYVDELR